MEADVLAVGRIVGQEMPSDRQAGFVRQATLDGDRRRPGPVRPGIDAIDRDRVPGERPHHGQLVDDAAEQDAAVQRPSSGAAGRAPRSRAPLEPDAAAPAPRSSMSSGGGSRWACASWLSLVGWRTVTSTARSAPIGVGRIVSDPDRLLDGRIEQLHVAEHQPFAVVVRALQRGQAIGLGRVAARAFAEHGQAALEGRPTRRRRATRRSAR